MKCKNCGAELNNGKCEYCGSVFLEDMRYVIPDINLKDVDIGLILRKSPIYIEDDSVMRVERIDASEITCGTVGDVLATKSMFI